MTLPAALVTTLQRWDRRRRRLLLLRGLSEAVVVTVGVATVAVVLDQLMTPGPAQRWALSLTVWGAGGGVFLWRGVIPALRAWTLLRIARHAEHLHGGLDERVSSAVALANNPAPGISPWMVARTVAMAAHAAAGITATLLLPLRQVRRQLVAGGAASAILLTLLVIPATGPWFVRALAPGVMLGRPSGYTIVVQPGDVRVARGAPLTISVRVDPTPELVQAVLTWEDGLSERLALSASDTEFTLDVPAVTRSFRYRIRADGGESAEATVTVVDPPVLTGVRVMVTPPEYTGLPVRISAGGDAEMVAGSRVSIVADADVELVQGLVLLREGHDDLAMTPRNDGQWQAQFLPETSQAFRLRLVGRDGIIVEPSTRWLLTVRPDAAPVVRAELLDAARGRNAAAWIPTPVETGLVARHEQVLVRIHAADDHGLRSLRLVVTDDTRAVVQRDVIAARDGAPRAVNRIEPIDVAELDVVEGDRLRIHVEAVDQGGVRSTSSAITVDVVGAAGAEAAQLVAHMRLPLRAMEEALADLRAAERGWAGLLRTFRAEDPAAQRGELLLLGSRSRQVSRDLSAVADDLAMTATMTDLAAGARILGIAERLQAWVVLHESMLASAVQQAITATAGTADRQRGRDLTDAAHRSLDPLRSEVLLVIARLEAEALVGATDAALRQARRAALVVRGMESWTTSRWSEGLAMVVREGITGEGKIVSRAVTLPHVDAALLTTRKEDLHIEWTGELRVPADGVYTFEVEVDDGARLLVNGQSILSPEAWRLQSSTRYTGTVALAAGWVPVEIAYFQGAGGAHFTVGWGQEGNSVQPLTLADVRHRPPGPDDAELMRAMLVASPAAGQRAREHIQRALTIGATVDGVLERLATETGRERLQHLALEAVAAATQLRKLTDSPVDAAEAAAVVTGLERVTQLAELARDHLKEAVDHDHEVGSPLAIARAMIAELRARVDVLHRLRDHLPAADREVTLRRESTAMQAMTQALTDHLQGTRWVQLERAQRQGATPVERMLVLSARESLASSTASALTALRETLTQLTTDRQVMSTLDTTAVAVETALKDAEQALIHADDERFAVRADALTTQLARMPAAASAQAMATAGDDLRTLASALRRRGRMASAQRLEAAMQDEDPTQAREALAAVATRPTATVDLLVMADAALVRSEQAFLDEAHRADLDPVREDLFATSLVVRVAALTLGLDHQRRADLGGVADDLESLAQTIQPSADVVADLRQRLQQIIEHTPDAHDAAEPFMAIAADVAAAITQPELRPDVVAALPRPSPPSATEVAALRAALAKRLEVAGSEEQRWALEEQRARDDFAAAELHTADTLTAATERLDPGDIALRHHLLVAAGEARRRSELARASSALPGAESAQLAAAAYRSAVVVEEQVVMPVALRALDDAAADRVALAELGLTLSDAVRLQTDAARRLQQVLVHRGAARVALARDFAAADHLMAGAAIGATDSAPFDEERYDSAAAREQAALATLAASVHPETPPVTAIMTHERILVETVRSLDARADPATIATAATILQAVGLSARALAADHLSHDVGVATQAAAQAAGAHQALMRATAPIVAQAMGAVAALRAVRGAPAPAEPRGAAARDPMEQALRDASAAVQAAPADDAAWRHAADVLARALSDRVLATTSSPPAGTALAAEDPFDRVPDRPVGDDQAEWIRSIGPLHSEIMSLGFERFSEEYQAAIRAYFRRIAQEVPP